MRATTIHAPGDIRVSEVPDPSIKLPTDAIVQVTAGCICGSDLWPYRGENPIRAGATIGHECIGVVAEVGSEVTSFRPGEFVVVPFCHCDNTCAHCRAGVQSACVNVAVTVSGQAEYARVTQADGSLVRTDGHPDAAMTRSLLALTDVMATGLARGGRGGCAGGRHGRRRRRRRRGPVRRPRRLRHGRGEDRRDVAPRVAPEDRHRVRRHPHRRRTGRGRRGGSRRDHRGSGGRRRARVRRHRRLDGHGVHGRAPGCHRGLRRRTARCGGAGAADVLQERRARRRHGPGAPLPARAARPGHRWPDRPGSGLRRRRCRWTRSPTAIAPWTSARRSRSSWSPSRPDRGTRSGSADGGRASGATELRGRDPRVETW